MPENIDPFALTGVGLLIVFAVLSIISGAVSLLAWLDDKSEIREAREKEAALTKDQNIDELTLVLISTAVATMIRGRYYIRSVRRVPIVSQHASSWSMQGRAVLHGSHLLPKKRS